MRQCLKDKPVGDTLNGYGLLLHRTAGVYMVQLTLSSDPLKIGITCLCDGVLHEKELCYALRVLNSQ